MIIVIGYWLFFKHNLINSSIKIIFGELELIKFEISSELSFFVIILLSIYFGVLIYKDNSFFKRFSIIFFFLSFSVTSFQILNHTLKLNKTDNSISSNIVFTDNLKKSKKNIYYFILDGMLPLQEFSEYYNYDTKSFLEFTKKNNFVYKHNTVNLYNNTTHGLSAIFYLDEIFDEQNNIKDRAKILYPSLLRKNNTSDLLFNLSNLDYEFKWLGNFFAYCPKFNLRYCLNTNENNLIDTYLYINFFRQSPLIQIIINVGYLVNFEFNKYFFYELNDGIGRLINYLKSDFYKENKSKNSYFYFIHHMSPHWPYITSKDCSYNFSPGKLNYEGYKDAYLCNLKKIEKFINHTNKSDPNSIIIFQSDHSWQMSSGKDSMKNIFNLVKIPRDCTYDQDQNLHNVNVLRLIFSCITGNQPQFLNN